MAQSSKSGVTFAPNPEKPDLIRAYFYGKFVGEARKGRRFQRLRQTLLTLEDVVRR